MPIPAAPGSSAPVALGIVPVGHQLSRFTALLDDLVLGVVDEYGVHMHIANLTGWWEGVGSTGTVEQQAQDHGGIPLPAYYTPRVMQLDLRLNGVDWDHVGAGLDRVLSRVSLALLRPFTVIETNRALTVSARQHGEPRTTREGATARASLSLIAPNPRRYELSDVIASTPLPSSSGGLQTGFNLPFNTAASTDGGTLQAVNAGNMPTSPVLTVKGPCPPFAITHIGTGQTLRYHDSLPTGRTLVLDTANRTALLDGTTPRFVSGSWFEYAPGINELAFSASAYDAGALLTSAHRNAWK